MKALFSLLFLIPVFCFSFEIQLKDLRQLSGNWYAKTDKASVEKILPDVAEIEENSEIRLCISISSNEYEPSVSSNGIISVSEDRCKDSVYKTEGKYDLKEGTFTVSKEEGSKKAIMTCTCHKSDEFSCKGKGGTKFFFYKRSNDVIFPQ